MGTKNNPGKFDCYAQAEPDEPMFVLLGRDPATPNTIDFWIAERKRQGKIDPDEMRLEAEVCANACADFRTERERKKHEATDYQRAWSLIDNELRALLEQEQPLDLRAIREKLATILERNQNPETADGSFTRERWTKIQRVVRSVESLLAALEGV